MIENTLLIRPKSGTFLKDVETFSKMDPFLKVSIGNELQKTDAHLNAGKNPVWKNELSFKLSNQQISQPDTVVINFEAYDEEKNKATGKFLGGTTYKLSQVRTGPNEATIIQLLDKKGNLSGTINVEFEVRQTRNPYDSGFNTQQSLQNMQYDQYNQMGTMGGSNYPYGQQGTMGGSNYPYGQQGTMGTSNFPQGQVSFGGQGDSSILIIRPQSGSFLKDADFFSGMDPWIKVTINNEVQRTETAKNAGKFPKWTQALTFRLPNQQIYSPETVLMNFEAFDEDSKTKNEFLGSVVVKLSNAKTRPGEITTIRLLDKKNKEVGTINVEFEIQSGNQGRFQTTDMNAQAGNLNNLIIRPKVGRFQKDADFFSKMDPLVKVTIGSETQRTETAMNAGKNATWKTPLNFKLSNQQVYYPDTVSITFEALDEDGKNKFEFLGSNVMKLSNAKLRPGEVTTIQLLDKKGKNAGMLEVEFEIQGGQNISSPTKQGGDKHMFKKPVVGTVVIKPTSAKFDSGVNDNEEFYLVLTHGEISYQSMMSEGTGKNPTFKDIISFSLFENEDMQLRVFDNDINRNEQVAEGFIQLSALARRGPLHNLLVPLQIAGRRMGELTVEVEFIPEIFDNLVRVYPTLSVKRGESITKKIQYTNPDRYKKTLSFKSTRRDLVLPTPETVTIQPNEFIEIKFKVSGPSTSEDRCRIDIIVEDTRFLEESLLFKIKSI